jgi:hypothetical protein
MCTDEDSPRSVVSCVMHATTAFPCRTPSVIRRSMKPQWQTALTHEGCKDGEALVDDTLDDHAPSPRASSYGAGLGASSEAMRVSAQSR